MEVRAVEVVILLLLGYFLQSFDIICPALITVLFINACRQPTGYNYIVDTNILRRHVLTLHSMISEANSEFFTYFQVAL